MQYSKFFLSVIKGPDRNQTAVKLIGADGAWRPSQSRSQWGHYTLLPCDAHLQICLHATGYVQEIIEKTRFVKRKVYLEKKRLWWRNFPLKTSSKICIAWSPHVIWDLCLHHRLHSSESAASVAALSEELKFADKQAQCFILSNWDWAELSTRLFILATRHFFQCSVAILQASSRNTANRDYSSHFAPYSPCLPLQKALLIDS